MRRQKYMRVFHSVNDEAFISASPSVLEAAESTLPTVETGITASTTQSQGERPLTADVNVVDTVGNTGDVVTLPSASAGELVTVIHNGASDLDVYPASGDDLGNGVNTLRTMVTGASPIRWLAIDSSTWVDIT